MLNTLIVMLIAQTGLADVKTSQVGFEQSLNALELSLKQTVPSSSVKKSGMNGCRVKISEATTQETFSLQFHLIDEMGTNGKTMLEIQSLKARAPWWQLWKRPWRKNPFGWLEYEWHNLKFETQESRDRALSVFSNLKNACLARHE